LLSSFWKNLLLVKVSNFEKLLLKSTYFRVYFYYFIPKMHPLFIFYFFTSSINFFCHFLFSSFKNPKNAFKFPIFFCETTLQLQSSGRNNKNKKSSFSPNREVFFYQFNTQNKKIFLRQNLMWWLCLFLRPLKTPTLYSISDIFSLLILS